MFNTILTHVHAHGDERTAIWMLRRRGEKQFPGVTKAVVVYTNGEIEEKGDEYCDREGVIPVGCGNGRFDEHPASGEARKRDECAATLVAKHLGIAEEKGLKAILADSLRCDQTQWVKETELPSIVKVLNRMGRKPEDIQTWLEQGLEALERVKTFDLALPPAGAFLSGVLTLTKKENRYGDERARNRVFLLTEESNKPKRPSVLELSYVTDCLSACHPESLQLVVNFAITGLDALYDDQIRYWRALSKFAEKASFREVVILHQGRDIREPFATIISDDERMNKVFRARESGRNLILLQRRSNGQVSIFMDTTRRVATLSYLVRMIRYLEMTPEERRQRSWHSLGADGQMEDVPNWYYFQRAEMFLNGSMSHPNVKATKLPLGIIVEAVLSAFHPRLTSRWRAKYENYDNETELVRREIERKRREGGSRRQDRLQRPESHETTRRYQRRGLHPRGGQDGRESSSPKSFNHQSAGAAAVSPEDVERDLADAFDKAPSSRE